MKYDALIGETEKRWCWMATLTRTVLTADLSGVAEGGWTFVHDYSLDGDEDLHVGDHVEVVDGCGRRVYAKVAKRDEEAGYWYLRIE